MFENKFKTNLKRKVSVLLAIIILCASLYSNLYNGKEVIDPKSQETIHLALVPHPAITITNDQNLFINRFIFSRFLEF